MLPIQTAVLRPKTWPALIPLALSILLFIGAYKAELPIFYFVGGFVAALSLLLWWFMGKTRLIVDNNGLTSVTKISTREFLWKDMTRSYIKFHSHGRKGTWYWHFDTVDGRTLSFATSHYSKKDLHLIAEVLKQKAPQAEINEKVLLMTPSIMNQPSMS